MKICKINFSENNFKNDFLNFCLSSEPFEEVEYGSRSLKNFQSITYLNSLNNSDLPIVIIDNNEINVFYAFFNIKNNDLDLEFCFPALNIMEDFEYSRLCFYSLCLYALNYFGKDSMTGTIMRKNKKNPFKMFLKRYVKAIEYKETKDNTNDLIYLSKKSIINHCEKLKFKSNWDEFLNKTS